MLHLYYNFLHGQTKNLNVDLAEKEKSGKKKTGY